MKSNMGRQSHHDAINATMQCPIIICLMTPMPIVSRLACVSKRVYLLSHRLRGVGRAPVS